MSERHMTPELQNIFGRTLEITYLGGNCPVEAEGVVNGVPFYFRARGESWSMSIGDDPVLVSCGDKEGWHREEEWGDGPFAAGWMPEGEVLRIIENCADEYVEQSK